MENNILPLEININDGNINADEATVKENTDSASRNDVELSNSAGSQNDTIEGHENVSTLESGNIDKDLLGDKNSSPSMLNELAEAIIADNFEALKDDKRNDNTSTMSSSKY